MAYAWGASGNAANAASGTNLTVSATYSAGDRVQVWVTYDSATTIPTTIGDGTNAYSLVTGSVINDASNTTTFALYECLNASAGTFTLSFTLASASTFRGLSYSRETGLDNSTAAQVAKNNQVAPGSGANALTSTNVTPASQPGGLIALVCDDTGGETSITAGTGFTNEGTLTNWDTAFGTKSRIEDKAISSTSAVAGTFTASPGSGTYGVIAIYIPTSGGGGGGATTTSVRKALMGVGI